MIVIASIYKVTLKLSYATRYLREPSRRRSRRTQLLNRPRGVLPACSSLASSQFKTVMRALNCFLSRDSFKSHCRFVGAAVEACRNFVDTEFRPHFSTISSIDWSVRAQRKIMAISSPNLADSYLPEGSSPKRIVNICSLSQF